MTTSLARGHVASSHEHALLLAAQRGDRRAQEELLRRYEPLVGHIVRRLRLPCRCERADIAQEARIALLGAIRAWQPARGPFHPFAAHCVHTKTATALSTARDAQAPVAQPSAVAGLLATPDRLADPGQRLGLRRRPPELMATP